MSKTTRAVVALVIVFAAAFPLILLNGTVLSDLWRWFVMPVFAVKALTWQQAVGLAMVVQWFKTDLPTKERKNSDEDAVITNVITGLISAAFGSLLFWGTAALFHWALQL